MKKDCIYSIPEECRLQIEKARNQWVKKHVDDYMDFWTRNNPAPSMRSHPMALDRYEEVYKREIEKSEQRFCDEFDKAVLPKGLEQFIKTLESDD